jgi:hypothetical protein
MFNRMQYFFKTPKADDKLTTWICHISDYEGNVLGRVTRKIPSYVFSHSTRIPQVWFDDANDVRIGEIRLTNALLLSDFGIYDHANEHRGIITRGTSFDRGRNWYSGGPFYLLDQTGKQVAISDPVNYARVNTSFALGPRFEDLMTGGLNIRAPDGSLIAIIHAAMASPGCQVDIYSSNVSQLLILSMVASLMFL